jgi:hypothetical protein
MENSKPSRSVVENLMCCPLCGAINATSNSECFCCTWQGVFEHEPEKIQESLADMLTYCPELENIIGPNATAPEGTVARLKELLIRLFWPTD